MPWIIDYATVLDRLQALGLRCNYPNGGAFGYPPEAGAQIRGWIGPPDDTIKTTARSLARFIPPPHEQNLAHLAEAAWQQHLTGNVWVMPASHWSFELNYGSRDWMPALIENLDLDPGQLTSRNNASAIEFSPDESPQFAHFIQRLLENLLSSDFVLVFPKAHTVCTLHHHKQLWWCTIDSQVLAGLDAIVPLVNPVGIE